MPRPTAQPAEIRINPSRDENFSLFSIKGSPSFIVYTLPAYIRKLGKSIEKIVFDTGLHKIIFRMELTCLCNNFCYGMMKLSLIHISSCIGKRNHRTAEGNFNQRLYCPDGSDSWRQRHPQPDLFRIYASACCSIGLPGDCFPAGSRCFRIGKEVTD